MDLESLSGQDRTALAEAVEHGLKALVNAVEGFALIQARTSWDDAGRAFDLARQEAAAAGAALLPKQERSS